MRAQYAAAPAGSASAGALRRPSPWEVGDDLVQHELLGCKAAAFALTTEGEESTLR